MYFSSLESMLCKESIDRVECGPCSQCLCDCFSDNVIFEMALQVAAKVARISLKKTRKKRNRYFLSNRTSPDRDIQSQKSILPIKIYITKWFIKVLLPNYKIQLPSYH
jgi:hypothetical protein